MQSIGNCVDELEVFLEEHPECMFLCLTEHWKTEDQLRNYGIKNFYLAASCCREENKHGGSAIYAKSGIKFREKREATNMSVIGQIECSVGEFEINKTKFIIMSIYRPPNGNVDIFLTKMEEILIHVVCEKSILIVAGDFNIDILSESDIKHNLISLFDSFNVFPTINQHTRITNKTKSCIDNIYTNYNNISNAQILHSSISDHTAQKVRIHINRVENRKFILKRNFGNEQKKDFLARLTTESWDAVYDIDQSNVNDSWNKFMEIFSKHFNASFPIKKVYTNNRNKSMPSALTDPEINECKNQLDILYVASSVDDRYKEQYRVIKKKYNKLLGDFKANQFQVRLEHSDNKSKCVWSIVNEIKGQNNLNRDTKLEGDPETISNDFNNYLINIAPQLTAQLKDFPYIHDIRENDKSMFVKPVSKKEIIDIVSNLKNKMSSGDDGVPTAIIKFCILSIIDPLWHIINNSLRFGVFPDKLKVAVVKPLHKKGNTLLFENYRPISLLPSFSKIFESVMCNRLMEFLLINSIINDMQHAYLKGRSTQTAIFQFTQKILEALEERNIALGLFLDLSKAYDCLNHDILLQKLEKYGIRGIALQWFSSYLTDRKQRVAINAQGNEIKSDMKSIKLGIPQGSITGPILFIMFINSLAKIINTVNCSMTNYADDTNLLIFDQTLPSIIIQSNKLMLDTGNYFQTNKLILNREKTNAVLFIPCHTGYDSSNNITINDFKLTLKNTTKFLGMYIDNTLSWQDHVNNVCKKIGTASHNIRVISRYVNPLTLKTVYYANFESRIRYGVIFYGNASNVNRIFIIQKRVIRIMFKLGFRETCRGKFKANNLLTFYGIYIQECLIFFFKNKNTTFKRCAPHHPHNTRTLDYVYPKHRLTVTEKGAFYSCIRLYNNLPIHIQQTNTLQTFKRQVHKLLVEIEPYNMSEYFNHRE